MVAGGKLEFRHTVECFRTGSPVDYLICINAVADINAYLLPSGGEGLSLGM